MRFRRRKNHVPAAPEQAPATPAAVLERKDSLGDETIEGLRTSLKELERQLKAAKTSKGKHLERSQVLESLRSAIVTVGGDEEISLATGDTSTVMSYASTGKSVVMVEPLLQEEAIEFMIMGATENGEKVQAGEAEVKYLDNTDDTATTVREESSLSGVSGITEVAKVKDVSSTDKEVMVIPEDVAVSSFAHVSPLKDTTTTPQAGDKVAESAGVPEEAVKIPVQAKTTPVDSVEDITRAPEDPAVKNISALSAPDETVELTYLQFCEEKAAANKTPAEEKTAAEKTAAGDKSGTKRAASKKAKKKATKKAVAKKAAAKEKAAAVMQGMQEEKTNVVEVEPRPEEDAIEFWMKEDTQDDETEIKDPDNIEDTAAAVKEKSLPSDANELTEIKGSEGVPEEAVKSLVQVETTSARSVKDITRSPEGQDPVIKNMDAVSIPAETLELTYTQFCKEKTADKKAAAEEESGAVNASVERVEQEVVELAAAKKTAARMATMETAEKGVAERAAIKKIKKKAAEKVAAEKAARDNAVKKAAEWAAAEKVEAVNKVAAEQVTKEKVQKEAAEKFAALQAAIQQAEKDAVKKAADEKAARTAKQAAIEKAKKEAAEEAAAEKGAFEMTEDEVLEKLAAEKAAAAAAAAIAAAAAKVAAAKAELEQATAERAASDRGEIVELTYNQFCADRNTETLPPITHSTSLADDLSVADVPPPPSTLPPVRSSSPVPKSVVTPPHGPPSVGSSSRAPKSEGTPPRGPASVGSSAPVPKAVDTPPHGPTTMASTSRASNVVGIPARRAVSMGTSLRPQSADTPPRDIASVGTPPRDVTSVGTPPRKPASMGSTSTPPGSFNSRSSRSSGSPTDTPQSEVGITYESEVFPSPGAKGHRWLRSFRKEKKSSDAEEASANHSKDDSIFDNVKMEDAKPRRIRYVVKQRKATDDEQEEKKEDDGEERPADDEDDDSLLGGFMQVLGSSIMNCEGVACDPVIAHDDGDTIGSNTLGSNTIGDETLGTIRVGNVVENAKKYLQMIEKKPR